MPKTETITILRRSMNVGDAKPQRNVMACGRNSISYARAAQSSPRALTSPLDLVSERPGGEGMTGDRNPHDSFRNEPGPREPRARALHTLGDHFR